MFIVSFSVSLWLVESPTGGVLRESKVLGFGFGFRFEGFLREEGRELLGIFLGFSSRGQGLIRFCLGFL